MTSSTTKSPNPYFIGRNWAAAIALLAALGVVSLFTIDTTGFALDQWIFYGGLFPFMGLTAGCMGYIAIVRHRKMQG